MAANKSHEDVVRILAAINEARISLEKVYSEIVDFDKSSTIRIEYLQVRNHLDRLALELSGSGICKIIDGHSVILYADGTKGVINVNALGSIYNFRKNGTKLYYRDLNAPVMDRGEREITHQVIAHSSYQFSDLLKQMVAVMDKV